MMADETDEDVFDNWEDIVDSEELERRLEKMRAPRTSPHNLDNESSETNFKPNMGPVIVQDGHRTQYVPPEPQVKILKRPANATKNVGILLINGEKVSKQPPKTLQQREAEYAQARLRILGAAKSDEEVTEEKLGKLSLAALSVEGTKPSMNVQIDTVPVVRQPKGPDGTKGFAFPR